MFICGCHNKEFKTQNNLATHLWYFKNKNISKLYTESVICSHCNKIYQNQVKLDSHLWYINNKERAQKNFKKYRKNILILNPNYDYQHNQKHKEYQYRHRLTLEHKKYMSNYFKEWLSIEVNKLASCMRGRIYQALKNINKTKDEKTLELLGCDFEFLKKYLELQFKPGMSWDNYGFYGWHVDHIKACANFDLTNLEEQEKCFHYSNLQPLWAKENQSKGAKVNA